MAREKKTDIKRFTLGYIDITGEGKGQAMNIGIENKKRKNLFLGLQHIKR